MNFHTHEFHFPQYSVHLYNPDSVQILVSVHQWYVYCDLMHVEQGVENQEGKLYRD
jgi:LEA14-like dessication related protein